jgi:hypothetical protein
MGRDTRGATHKALRDRRAHARHAAVHPLGCTNRATTSFTLVGRSSDFTL